MCAVFWVLVFAAGTLKFLLWSFLCFSLATVLWLRVNNTDSLFSLQNKEQNANTTRTKTYRVSEGWSPAIPGNSYCIMYVYVCVCSWLAGMSDTGFLHFVVFPTLLLYHFSFLILFTHF